VTLYTADALLLHHVAVYDPFIESGGRMNNTCPKCGTIVSAEASGGGGKIFCLKCFTVELERLLVEHERAKQALVSAIARGFETMDDHRSGAYSVPDQVYAEFDRNIGQIETETREWASLDDDSKRNLRKRLDGLRKSPALLRTRNLRRFSALEELIKQLRRLDLPRFFDELNKKVQELEVYPLEQRRNLLKETRELISENKVLMERHQLLQISQMITQIRKAAGRKWWEFWL
jgi:hypothetical protein